MCDIASMGAWWAQVHIIICVYALMYVCVCVCVHVLTRVCVNNISRMYNLTCA